MQEALLLIAAYQAWIYLSLALVAAVYGRLAARYHAQARAAQFGLERERATAGRTRALGMLGLTAGAAIATFIVSTSLAPSIPPEEQPTSIPTISLLQSAGTESASSAMVTAPDSGGCLNSNATISDPVGGQEIRGLVEINGTANIANFAFYKIEIKTSEPSAVWQVVTAGTEPVVEELLGVWDTSLVQNGVYLLQLVVTDTEGNAPLPCTIELVILPAGG